MNLAWLPLVLLAASTVAQDAALAEAATALDRGDFERAAEIASVYIAAHPKSSPARVVLARAEMGRDKPAAAMKQLQEALRVEIGNPEALYYLSKLAGILSAQAFLDVEKLGPDSPRTHQLRAEGFVARGENQNAEREYLAALQTKPGDLPLTNALADIQRHNGRYAEALKRYGQVLARDRGNYDALYGSGACLFLSRQVVQALPYLRLAVKASPDSPAAKIALAAALLKTTKPGEALGLLEDVADVDPEVRQLQFLLGKAYQATGQARKANAAFEKYRAMALREPASGGDEADLP